VGDKQEGWRAELPTGVHRQSLGGGLDTKFPETGKNVNVDFENKQNMGVICTKFSLLLPVYRSTTYFRTTTEGGHAPMSTLWLRPVKDLGVYTHNINKHYQPATSEAKQVNARHERRQQKRRDESEQQLIGGTGTSTR